MIYTENKLCISEKAQLLVKEKDKKYFRYQSIKKIIKMLEEKKEIYSFNHKVELNKITKIEYLGVQEFLQLKAFSGSRIIIGKDVEIFIVDEWIKVYEARFHEQVFEYDFLKDLYKETYLTEIAHYGKLKAYRIYSEDENGIIVNNFIIRFVDETIEEATAESEE